ncbi:MAG: 3'-5' exonuclease [Bacillota bacterium]|jgi:DNA polymerase-3 subunit epsilon
MYYLFFDTETTGLPKSWNASVHKLDNWPRMVQLAWSLRGERGEVLQERSKIIRPEGFTIPKEASRIHGITTAKANQEGELLVNVLNDFCQVLNRDNLTLVAHNMRFDEKIVGAELLRMHIQSNFFALPKICTMKSSIDFCNLPDKKYPKLEELYYILFKTVFKDAHSADSDVAACARCFFELKKKKVV